MSSVEDPYKTPEQHGQPRARVGHYVAKEDRAIYVKKRRMLYVLLAILIGTLGVHNFYAGRTGSALAQLFLTIGGGLIGLPLALFVLIWNIGEMIAVTTDGEGEPFG